MMKSFNFYDGYEKDIPQPVSFTSADEYFQYTNNTNNREIEKFMFKEADNVGSMGNSNI